MKRLLSAFLAAALFLSFSVQAFAYDSWPHDDLSPWDAYEVVDTQSFGSGSFEIYLKAPGYASLLSSSTGSISNQKSSNAGSSRYCDELSITLKSSSAALDPGKIYRINVHISFGAGFSAHNASPAISHVGVSPGGNAILAANGSGGGGGGVYLSPIDFTVIYQVTSASSVYPTFLFDIDGCNILDNQFVEFTANATVTYSEIQEPQLSIEEWLGKIYDEIEGQDDQLQQDASDAVPDDFQQQQGEASEQLQQYDQAEQQFTTDLNDSLTSVNPEQYSIPTGIVAAMSWINGYITQGFTGLGDYNIILFLPMVLGLSLAVIGRFGRVISSRPTRSRGGGDPPSA